MSVVHYVCAQAFAPPPFDISRRLPLVLNTVFVTLAYSSGMPILIPFAMCAMVTMYWTEKYSLLRVCAKPPNLGPSLAEVVLSFGGVPVRVAMLCV